MVELHKESYTTALLRGEAAEWNESFFENRRCAEFLSELINERNTNYSDLPQSCIKDTVKEFGYDRTMWVIANTASSIERINGICKEHLEWARKLGIEVCDINYELSCSNNFVNKAVSQVKDLYAQLDFYGNGDTVPKSRMESFEGKIVILSPSVLKEQYRFGAGSSCDIGGRDIRIDGDSDKAYKAY